MDFELIEKALPILLLGAGVTIEITAGSKSLFVGFIFRICAHNFLPIFKIFVFYHKGNR